METYHILIVDDTPEELTNIIAGLSRRLQQQGIVLEHEVAEDTPSAIGRLGQTSHFDLVLLDIIGVAWEEFLQQCPGFRPYLPVVMLSRQAIASEVVKCIDAGASSFIFKLDFTLDGVQPQTKFDEAEDRAKWNAVIGKIHRLIWQRQLFLSSGDNYNLPVAQG